MHMILLAICIIVIIFIFYQIYNSLYLVLVGIDANFSIESIVIVVTFVCNLALGTGYSPMTPTIHIGTSILDIEEYAK